MALTRVAVTRTEIIIEDGTELKADLSLVTDRTEEEIKTILLGTNTIDTEFWIHKNRDGSIAIATRAEPDYWPEDEPGEEPETELIL